MHRKYEDYAKVFESMFNPEMLPPDWEHLDWPAEDTSVADYVWLPLRFVGEKVYILIGKTSGALKIMNK